MKSEQLTTFQEIYDACYGELYRLICATYQDEEDTERIVQEIFWRAYRSFPQYRGESPYKIWLFSIAHEYQTNWRAKWRRKRAAAAGPSAAVFVDTESPVARSNDPRRWKEQVTAACRRLPNEQRQALLLETVYRLSGPDLTVIFNLSEGRVRELINDGTHAIWDAIDREARESITEALFGLSVHPTDLELIEAKSNGWNLLLKRARQQTLRARWLPVAGLAVVALGVAGAVFLPGELKRDAVPAVPANTQSAGEAFEVPISMAEDSQYKRTKARFEFYQAKKYKMIHFGTAENPVDIIYDKESIYSVHWEPGNAQAVRKLLLRIPTAEEPRFRGGGEHHVVFGIRDRSTGDLKEQFYALDLQEAKLIPLPLIKEGSVASQFAIPGDDREVCYYLYREGLTTETNLLAYDLKTGVEKKLHTFEPKQGIKSLWSEGTDIVLWAEKELMLLNKSEGTLQPIVQNEPHVEPIQMVNGKHIVYLTGSLGDGRPYGEYNDKTSVMLYDLQTGQSRPALQQREGAQWAILNFLGEKTLIGQFKPSRVPADGNSTSDLPGTLQIWQIGPGQPEKLLYTREMTWGARVIEFHGIDDKNPDSYYLRGGRGQGWALLYDQRIETLTEVDVKTLPQQE